MVSKNYILLKHGVQCNALLLSHDVLTPYTTAVAWFSTATCNMVFNRHVKVQHGAQQAMYYCNMVFNGYILL